LDDLGVLAITREVSAAIVRCELTHLQRAPIDVTRAQAQHRAYEMALESLGCEIRRLPADPDMPDSVFIEDTAVVLPDVAIVTRPGAGSRRREIDAVADALALVRPLVLMTPPATLDGGDVLVVDRTVFVGRSTRTNDAGIEQLREAVTPFGCTVVAIETRGCLHLKSAVTALDPATLLMNPVWVPRDSLRGFAAVDVDPSEPSAANVVSIRRRVLAAAAYPRTAERLSRAGFDVTIVEADELAKAEGALTCCSLLVE
jgi:dimethylargininase